MPSHFSRKHRRSAKTKHGGVTRQENRRKVSVSSSELRACVRMPMPGRAAKSAGRSQAQPRSTQNAHWRERRIGRPRAAQPETARRLSQKKTRRGGGGSGPVAQESRMPTSFERRARLAVASPPSRGWPCAPSGPQSAPRGAELGPAFFPNLGGCGRGMKTASTSPNLAHSSLVSSCAIFSRGARAERRAARAQKTNPLPEAQAEGSSAQWTALRHPRHRCSRLRF